MTDPKSQSNIGGGVTKTKDPLYTRDCRLCGAPLAILVDAEGKQIGLDLDVPVYSPTVKGTCVRTTLALPDHRMICKKLPS